MKKAPQVRNHRETNNEAPRFSSKFRLAVALILGVVIGSYVTGKKTDPDQCQVDQPGITAIETPEPEANSTPCPLRLVSSGEFEQNPPEYVDVDQCTDLIFLRDSTLLPDSAVFEWADELDKRAEEIRERQRVEAAERFIENACIQNDETQKEIIEYFIKGYTQFKEVSFWEGTTVTFTKPRDFEGIGYEIFEYTGGYMHVNISERPCGFVGDLVEKEEERRKRVVEYREEEKKRRKKWIDLTSQERWDEFFELDFDYDELMREARWFESEEATERLLIKYFHIRDEVVGGINNDEIIRLLNGWKKEWISFLRPDGVDRTNFEVQEFRGDSLYVTKEKIEFLREYLRRHH